MDIEKVSMSLARSTVMFAYTALMVIVVTAIGFCFDLLPSYIGIYVSASLVLADLVLFLAIGVFIPMFAASQECMNLHEFKEAYEHLVKESQKLKEDVSCVHLGFAFYLSGITSLFVSIWFFNVITFMGLVGITTMPFWVWYAIKRIK